MPLPTSTTEETRDITIIQQIPDIRAPIALCIDDDDRPWQLKQVFGWRPLQRR